MSVRHFTNPLKPKKETPGTNKSLQKRSLVHVHTSHTSTATVDLPPISYTPHPPRTPARLLHFRLLWLAEARCIDHVGRVFNRRIRALATGTTPRPSSATLYHTTELVKKWPESDDTSTHVETTTKLIGLAPGGCGDLSGQLRTRSWPKGGTADPGDKKLSDELRKVQVPLDLLELLDYGGGINPDTYARALLREADRQIKKLNRREARPGLAGL